MPVKIRRTRTQRLVFDLEMRLVEGWNLDTNALWDTDFEFRKKCWFRHRDALIARWGDVTKLYGWFEFEAKEAQRAAFLRDECPSPARAVRDGIGTISMPENPAIQARRAASEAQVVGAER
jgi:hypothetical protein